MSCASIPAYDVQRAKNTDGDTGNSENYIEITLSSVVSKVFEMCLLETYDVFLLSSRLIFGFKTNSGCANAIYLLFNVCDRVF